ncbi:MAG: twin-arginine translocase subunit TatC [Mariprofundaceae bacterium]
MSDAESGLTSHLRELRDRLMRAVICLVLGFAVCYAFSDVLLDYVVLPLRSQLGVATPMIFISLPEVFFAHLKVSFVSALFLTSPYLLYQVWSFIAPGLYKHERQLFVLFLVGSTLLFVAGGAFAYAFVMPLVFKFFLGFSSPDLVAFPTMQLYLSLVLRLTVAFGVAFEVPLICIVLVKLGVISIATMRRQRRWVLVGAFVLGAVLTPPDIISQVMLAIPVYCLFELGLFVAQRLENSQEVHVESG